MRQGVLRHALTARPTAADFEIVEAARPACPADGLVLQTAYVSLDPFVGSRLRGRHMGEPAPEPGQDPIPGYAVGRVIESRHPDFKDGDWIHTRDGGWREQIAVPADTAHKIDIGRAPPALYLSALGMPGLTAWAGVTQCAKVKAGDVFTVDAAAGAVGGCAGQIARLSGAERVVGIAGGPQKGAVVEDLYKFDACIDYKAEGWETALAEALPGGVDAHFENVGVGMLNRVLTHLNPYGRVVVCGLVDQYHVDQKPAGVDPGLIVGKRANVMGLVVYDFFSDWPRYIDEAADWAADGKLNVAEDCSMGLASAPAQFEKLMMGRNTGKALVKIDPDAP